MKKIRKAISIVLHHQEEIFIITRQNYLRAFPGYTAFPGGKVEENEIIDLSHDAFKKFPKDHMQCLVREAQEELGINLNKGDNIKKITHLASATTPSFNPYRFETYFYFIDLMEKPTFDLDENEHKEGKWMSAHKVLAEFNQGKRVIVEPIQRVLNYLAAKKKEESLPLTFEGRFDDATKVPYITSMKGITQVMPLSDTVPPAERTNAFIIGEVLIDPSPKDDKELDKFLKTIEDFKLEKIFITHHHPDHHKNLHKLNAKLELPVFMSQYTYEKIQEKYGEEYLQKMQTSFVKEGDTLCQWLDHDVNIYEIPGHDEGHLGLAPSNQAWFLVGDLFQGVGTVVVGGEEGDMQKYFATLKRVIYLQPSFVIPSHGIILGGTSILEKTLEHRMLREKQVLELSLKGYSIEKILKHIYSSIPSKLLYYAKLNIESHQDKLKKEGKL